MWFGKIFRQFLCPPSCAKQGKHWIKLPRAFSSEALIISKNEDSSVPLHPCLMSDHPDSEFFFPNTWSKFLLLQHVSVVPHPFTLHIQEESGSFYCITTHFFLKITIRQPHFNFSQEWTNPTLSASPHTSFAPICIGRSPLDSKMLMPFLSLGSTKLNTMLQIRELNAGEESLSFTCWLQCYECLTIRRWPSFPRRHTAETCTRTHDPFLQRCFLAKWQPTYCAVWDYSFLPAGLTTACTKIHEVLVSSRLKTFGSLLQGNIAL